MLPPTPTFVRHVAYSQTRLLVVGTFIIEMNLPVAPIYGLFDECTDPPGNGIHALPLGRTLTDKGLEIITPEEVPERAGTWQVTQATLAIPAFAKYSAATILSLPM
jgi:hypothetical protein